MWVFIIKESSTTLLSARNLCFDNTPLKMVEPNHFFKAFLENILYPCIDGFIILCSIYSLSLSRSTYPSSCSFLKSEVTLLLVHLNKTRQNCLEGCWQIPKQTVHITKPASQKTAKMLFAALTAEDLKYQTYST